MEKRQHLYVSRKNVLTWLMALCLVASAVVRILVFGVKGTDGSVDIWTQIILPVAAAGLYVFIALVRGKETFYQTAIPIWMMAIYGGLWASRSFTDTLHIWFFWAILILLAVFYTHLTSGRQQRVGIARALASEPKVLLCDEATSALEPQTTKAILELIRDINRKLQLTVVVITHEMQVIKDICDKVAVIDKGVIECYNETVKKYDFFCIGS